MIRVDLLTLPRLACVWATFGYENKSYVTMALPLVVDVLLVLPVLYVRIRPVMRRGGRTEPDRDPERQDTEDTKVDEVDWDEKTRSESPTRSLGDAKLFGYVTAYTHFYSPPKHTFIPKLSQAPGKHTRSRPPPGLPYPRHQPRCALSPSPGPPYSLHAHLPWCLHCPLESFT